MYKWGNAYSGSGCEVTVRSLSCLTFGLFLSTHSIFLVQKIIFFGPAGTRGFTDLKMMFTTYEIDRA